MTRMATSAIRTAMCRWTGANSYGAPNGASQTFYSSLLMNGESPSELSNYIYTASVTTTGSTTTTQTTTVTTPTTTVKQYSCKTQYRTSQAGTGNCSLYVQTGAAVTASYLNKLNSRSFSAVNRLTGCCFDLETWRDIAVCPQQR